MAEWITPVYDRSLKDVNFAIEQVAKWRTQGFTTTYELKGCMNVTDMNRIENDIQFLSDNLSALYYPSTVVSKTWNRSMLPTVVEVERIISNLQALISSFYKSVDAPELPDTMLHFEQINSIEKNLYLLKQLLDGMQLCYRKCGTFECGEEW